MGFEEPHGKRSADRVNVRVRETCAAAQLGVTTAVGPSCCEALQKSRPAQLPQLAA